MAGMLQLTSARHATLCNLTSAAFSPLWCDGYMQPAWLQLSRF